MALESDRFYVTGGNLKLDAACYVVRQADGDLLEGLKNGDFCYVLNTRQMGKSSLMVRTAANLRKEGYCVATLDLTSVGQNLAPEQWYYGLLLDLARQLQCVEPLKVYWKESKEVGAMQRWINALSVVVLPFFVPSASLIIFIDEIDAVRSLPFSTDEFFAGIRECYNRRARQPEMRRLTFCLLGVATPGDLIQDTRSTPFNIGKRIELNDFTPEEAAPLAIGLTNNLRATGDASAAENRKLLDRVFYWTHGHPYLTQRLCQAVAEQFTKSGCPPSPADVDWLCDELYLSRKARETDDNLAFVRNRMLQSEADRASLLDLYRHVRKSWRGLPFEEADALVSILRLSGIARVKNGRLFVRNRIYARVFDKAWIIANMPDAELRRQRRTFWRAFMLASAGASVIIVLLTGMGLYALEQAKKARISEQNEKDYSGKLAVALKKQQSDAQMLAQTLREMTKEKKLADQMTRNAESATERESKLRRAAENEAAKAADEKRVYTGVFAGCVKKNGVYEGICPLTTEEMHHRNLSFRLTRHGKNGRIERMEVVDGKGNLTYRNSIDAFISPSNPNSGFNPNKECDYHLDYDANGRVINESAFDRNGNRVWVFHYTLQNAAQYLDANGFARSRAASGASYVHFKRNTAGVENENFYFDKDNNPQPDRDRIFGYRYELDSRGLITKQFALGADGKPAFGLNSVPISTAQLDPKFGVPTVVAFFDANGKPTGNRDGAARVVNGYDRYGNLIRTDYYDLNGQPVPDRNGIAKYRYTINADGYVSEMACSGTDNKPAYHKLGYSRLQMRYDAKGNISEFLYLGADGKPVIGSNGASRTKMIFGPHGQMIEQSWDDTANRPVRALPGGFSKVKYAWNGLNSVEESYYAPDGSLTLCSQGYARYRKKTDENGTVLEEACYGRNGRLIRCNSGYARYVGSTDQAGNIQTRTYFDENGKPTPFRGASISGAGYTRQELQYDKNGNAIEEAFFGMDGKPIKNSFGVARIVRTYDTYGNTVAEKYYDGDNHLTLCSAGFASRKNYFNAAGYLLQESYLDVNGQPARYGGRYAKIVYQRDLKGRLLSKTFFDELNAPVAGENGVPGEVFAYDARGNQVEIIFRDGNGSRTVDRHGVSRYVKQYDPRGIIIAERSFDTEDRPCLYDKRYALALSRVDSQGRVREYRYFDTANKPFSGIARIVFQYDASGRTVETRWYGSDNRPLAPALGAARRLNMYNGGVLTEYRLYYRDSHDKPAFNPQGYAEQRTRLNAQGLEAEKTFLDTEEKPALADHIYSRMTMRYNDRALPEESNFYDREGKSPDPKKGYARVIIHYMPSRIEQTLYWLDSEGKPANNVQGACREERIWDASANLLLARRFYHIDGSPVRTRSFISTINSAGPGARAGLQQNDIILSYDGKPVNSMLELNQMAQQVGIGDAEIKLLRQGTPHTLHVPRGLLGVGVDSMPAPEPSRHSEAAAK